MASKYETIYITTGNKGALKDALNQLVSTFEGASIKDSKLSLIDPRNNETHQIQVSAAHADKFRDKSKEVGLSPQTHG